MASRIFFLLALFFIVHDLDVYGERRVFPMIFNGRPPWHPFGRYYRVKGKWIDTSGTAKFCNGHDECYDRREPDEWCPMKPDDGEVYG